MPRILQWEYLESIIKEDETEEEPVEPWEDDEEGQMKLMLSNIQPARLLYTPYGVVPLDSNLNQLEDCWVGHTNFTISRTHEAILDKIEGVEIFKPFSRYRFLIGVGKLFNSADVKFRIQKALEVDSRAQYLVDNFNLDDKTQTKVNALIDKISNKHEFWTVWVLPNGSIETACTDDFTEEYLELETVLLTGHKMVGGALYQSDLYLNN